MIKSFFISLITILLFLASFGYIVYRLQDPQFIVEQSRSVNLYGRLVGNVGQFLPSDQLKSFSLETADVTDILQSSIDGEQFYGFMEKASNAYLPWLTGKTDALKFSYELGEVKQKLSDAVRAKILVKYNNLPLCTSAQLRTWDFDNNLPSCQLASGTLKADSINNLATRAATQLTEDLPDSFSAGQNSPQLLNVKNKVALVFKIIYLLWTATLLLLLLYLLIFRASGFIALAVSFLLVGLLQIVFSLVGWDLITKTIADLIGGSGEAKSIVPIIIDLVAVILGAMKTVLGNISIGFLIMGGVLVVIGIVSKLK